MGKYKDPHEDTGLGSAQTNAGSLVSWLHTGGKDSDPSRYPLYSFDFNFKSQVLRSIDIQADNSRKILLDTIFRVNSVDQAVNVELDLVPLL